MFERYQMERNILIDCSDSLCLRALWRTGRNSLRRSTVNAPGKLPATLAISRSVISECQDYTGSESNFLKPAGLGHM